MLTDADQLEDARRGVRIARDGLRSDLDLVVIHDGAAAGAQSDGRRPLAAGQWAARFTQVLVTALTAPTAEGRLYEVDLRLRPSGRQGPVATSLAAFRAYQASEAWVWEHLALTRARPLAGDAALMVAVEAARRATIGASRFARGDVLDGLAEMRGRLGAGGGAGAGLSVRAGPGRMRDVALAAQAHALLARSPARDVAGQLAGPGWLDADARATLAAAHAAMARVEQAARLLTAADPPEGLGTGGEAFVARAAGHPDVAAAAAAMDAAAARAAAAIDAALRRAGA